MRKDQTVLHLLEVGLLVRDREMFREAGPEPLPLAVLVIDVKAFAILASRAAFLFEHRHQHVVGSGGRIGIAHLRLGGGHDAVAEFEAGFVGQLQRRDRHSDLLRGVLDQRGFNTLADIVIASDDARFGTPYSRVWGCHLSGMWVYRLGLAKAKYYALTGEWISGKEAAKIELINFSYPLEELDAEVDKLAAKLAKIPLTQLTSMKLIVNQTYDNMGLQSTQTLGPILDGIMRNTPEGREFVRVAASEGVKSAVIKRDGPFADYSQAPPDQHPRKRSELA